MLPQPRRISPELIVLTAIAFLTRFWGLLAPNEVVWDEVHYERFAGAYFTGNYYVDVHPPLGKLLFAATAKVLGVSGAVLANNGPAPLLRVLPALCGALIIPLVYLLLREIGAGRRTATIGAAFLLVDNALLVESRFILPDVPLLFSGLLAVLLFAKARHASGTARAGLIAATAVAGGVAIAIKWTGLSALGLIGLIWAVDALRSQRFAIRRLLAEGVMLAAIPVAVYVGSFAVHFALLRHSGPGDMWMSDAFRSTLVGEPGYDPASHVPFTTSFVELNRQMGAINAEWGSSEHPGASKWYTWPIAKHSILFYSSRDGERGLVRGIVLFANPLVWWGVIAGVLAIIIASVRKSPRLVGRGKVLVALAIGYVANFVPFAFIQRPMFLYHYFFALVYSVLFAAVGVGALAGWDDDSGVFTLNSRSSRFFAALLAAASLLFLYLAPLSYGGELTDSAILHRRWILERHIGVSTDR